jgi:hypothetical protein
VVFGLAGHVESDHAGDGAGADAVLLRPTEARTSWVEMAVEVSPAPRTSSR